MKRSRKDATASGAGELTPGEMLERAARIRALAADRAAEYAQAERVARRIKLACAVILVLASLTVTYDLGARRTTGRVLILTLVSAGLGCIIAWLLERDSRRVRLRWTEASGSDVAGHGR